MGCIAKTFEMKTPQEKCTMSSTLHTFLSYLRTDLQDLNGDQTPFTYMVSVPGTHKAKILYGLCYRNSGIVQFLPITKKFLALFVEGSATMGPAQVIMLDDSIRAHNRAINLTYVEI